MEYQNYYIYKTLQGDTWDSIALDFYNSESYSSALIQANPELITALIFDAGTALIIPIIDQPTPSTLPPWKRGAAT